MTALRLPPDQQADQLRHGLPEVLRGLRRYLPYQLRPRASGRMGKVPVRPGAGGTYRAVSPLDERAHLTFEEALAALRTGLVDGIGLALDERIPVVGDLPLCAVDLDHVVQGGGLTPQARRLVEALDSWTELSQSGAGLHVLVAGRLPPHGRRGEAELITTGYLALTGARWPGTPAAVEVREAALRRLHARQSAGPPAAASTPPPCPEHQVDDVVLRRLAQARNGAKFSALYAGDLGYHGGDASRADLALLRMMLWATRDPAQVLRLWQRSALHRPDRWARPCRRLGNRTLTYAEATLARALELAS